MHLPFYLIFAVDPAAARSFGHQITHWTYEADRRRDTTLDAVVETVRDRDLYPIESVWFVNPGAGTMTDATVEVLEELEERCEREGQFAPRHALPAMKRYGVRYREPLVHDGEEPEFVEDHDPVYRRPALTVVHGGA